MAENHADGESAGKPAYRARVAERLLLSLQADGAPSLKDLAVVARISERRLAQCRDAVRPLDALMQMRLAAAVADLAPHHRRLAYRLYGQAQSALRTSLSGDSVHTHYPKSQFR